MDYRGLIQKVLWYIDENITDELNADILADVAGFSPYHFCRVFHWYAGYSVMGYVRSRRLAFAAAELSSGRKLIDIAMDYGFETHSGFSKAFKRRYGMTPEAYRIHAKADRPPPPDLLRMNEYAIGGIVMEPKFITLPAIKLAGYELKTKNIDGQNTKEIPEFWYDYVFNGRREKLLHEDFIKNHTEYGACFPEDPANSGFSYVIGMEVKDGAEIPAGLHTCVIPPATYVVFSTPPCSEEEFTKNIQWTWQYIMSDWFPASGYEYAGGCVDFELYDDRCRAETDRVMDIYVPVVKK